MAAQSFLGVTHHRQQRRGAIGSSADSIKRQWRKCDLSPDRDHAAKAINAANHHDRQELSDFSILDIDETDKVSTRSDASNNNSFRRSEDESSSTSDFDVWVPPPTTQTKRRRQKATVGSSWMDRNQKFMADVKDSVGITRQEKEPPATKGKPDSLPRPFDDSRGTVDSDESLNEGRSFRQDFRGTRVFVQNIPMHVTWQDLKDHFRIAGEVVFASVSVDSETGLPKGNGVVQFESTDGAKKAIAIMRDHPLDGSNLFVRADVQTNEGAVLRNVSPGGRQGPTPPSVWRCADEDILVEMDPEVYKTIRSLIKARDQARRRKNYDASDEIREELKFQHDVHIDDRLKMWWVSPDGKQVPSAVSSIKGDGRWGNLEPWRHIPTTPEHDLCVSIDLVEGLLRQRDIARREKDFTTADKLLEQARICPDGELTLRIHDESRTWRVWTDTPPPMSKIRRPVDESRDRRSVRDADNDNYHQSKFLDNVSNS